jgi:hypothetical protein
VSHQKESFERVLVLVETAERTFRGYLYRPVSEREPRLSDYLNNYSRPFISLADVAVYDRGQTHRAGERREFVAIAVSAVTFITPMSASESLP